MAAKTINMMDLFPADWFAADGRLSWSAMSASRERAALRAEARCRELGTGLRHVRAVLLIDVQGVYLKLLEWFETKGLPPSSYLVNRVAADLLSEAIQAMRQRERNRLGPELTDYEDLLRSCEHGDEARIAEIRDVFRFSCRVEIFYAHFDMGELSRQIRFRLSREASGQSRALDERSKASYLRGKVPMAFDDAAERDYRFFDDFIDSLATCLGTARREEGFFSMKVRDDLRVKCDEKEVDTRVVIRAMDIGHTGQEDALCIVSNDQDYAPLHQRWADGPIRTYHADVSNFATPWLIGHKLKELGEDRLLAVKPTRFLPEELLNEVEQHNATPRPTKGPREVWEPVLTREQVSRLWDLDRLSRKNAEWYRA